MNGVSLELLCRKDPVLSKEFRGVLTLTEINSWPEPHAYLPVGHIINTETKKNGPGEHWVALYISRDGYCDYFDSYGTAPLEPIYRWLLERDLTPVHYNKKWLQSPKEKICGAYCLLFLKMRARGFGMTRILTLFTDGDHAWNDALAMTSLLPEDANGD